MALRWRKDGKLLCAAESKPEEGDTYLDDRVHYHLSEILYVIKPIGEGDDFGKSWKWRFSLPPENRRKKVKNCLYKIPMSKEEADSEATKLGKSSYECDVCFQWHLTSQPESRKE